MPIKQRKTSVTVIPTTRFKSKGKSTTTASVKAKQSQGKSGYGVKSSTNSLEGGVRKRTRPPITKSRPGYALYSTDSEEQIGEVDKGLTKCANIVKQMLEVRKGRNVRPTSDAQSSSSQSGEINQPGKTSPRQTNRPPVVIPTASATGLHGNRVNPATQQGQPLFNKRLATSTPDPDKMESSTVNLEKVAGYFRKTPSNPSSSRPQENAQNLIGQKPNQPQGHFLQQILNADQQDYEQSVSTQQSGVPQGVVYQPFLYNENLARSQNSLMNSPERNRQHFQGQITPTPRAYDSSQVYSDNSVKSNYQRLENDRQNTFVQPGPVLVDIPTGMNNTLDESEYHQLPSPQSLFQGYKGIQSDSNMQSQIHLLNPDTIPVLRQSEGFVPHISRTNTSDSLQTSGKNLTYTRFEPPVKDISLVESGLVNGPLSSDQSNRCKPATPAKVMVPVQRGQINNQTFTSPPKQIERTNGNAPELNHMGPSLSGIPQNQLLFQARPFVDRAAFQTPEISNHGTFQSWAPVNQVDFRAGRSVNQPQFPAGNSGNQNIFQLGASSNQMPDHRIQSSNQMPDHRIQSSNQMPDHRNESSYQMPLRRNQSYFNQSLEPGVQSQVVEPPYLNPTLPPSQAFNETVQCAKQNLQNNPPPVMGRVEQGAYLWNGTVPMQQAPAYSNLTVNPTIANPPHAYHGQINSQSIHPQIDQGYFDSRQNPLLVQGRDEAKMQFHMRMPVSDFEHSRTVGLENDMSNTTPRVTPNPVDDAGVAVKAPLSQNVLRFSDPGTDLRAEIDKAMQPLLLENKQLRSNLRAVSEQMKDLEREWTNQQLRQKDVEKDSTNQRVFEAEKPFDSSDSSSRVQSLESNLDRERARADNLESELKHCRPELEQYKQDRQKLLQALQEKDAEKLRLRLSNQSEVRNLHTEVELQQKQAEAYRLKLDASEKECHILQITLKQRDAEIDRLQELVLTMKTSMSELIREQHCNQGNSQLAASFNLQRLERLLREGNPNSEDPNLMLMNEIIPFETAKSTEELSDDSATPLTVDSLAEHNERSSLEGNKSQLNKDTKLFEEIEKMNLFEDDDLLSFDETVTETTTTTGTSNQHDSTISTIKDADHLSNDIQPENDSTSKKKSVHFDEVKTASSCGHSLDNDLESVISDEPSRYSVTDYFAKYPSGTSNTQKSAAKGHNSSRPEVFTTEAPQTSNFSTGQSTDTSGGQESSSKGDNPIDQQNVKKPPPRPPPPLRKPQILQDDDANSVVSGVTYSSLSTVATVDESVFRAGLANLDANIARLQESLQQKKALLSL